jgi:acyl carrier protein
MTANTLIATALNRPLGEIPRKGHFSQISGWDSLGHMRIMLSVEASLGRELTSMEMLTLTTIESIEEILKSG